MHLWILVQNIPEQTIENVLYIADHFTEGIFSSRESAETFLGLYGMEYQDLFWHQRIEGYPHFTAQMTDEKGIAHTFSLTQYEVDTHNPPPTSRTRAWRPYDGVCTPNGFANFGKLG